MKIITFIPGSSTGKFSEQCSRVWVCWGIPTHCAGIKLFTLILAMTIALPLNWFTVHELQSNRKQLEVTTGRKQKKRKSQNPSYRSRPKQTLSQAWPEKNNPLGLQDTSALCDCRTVLLHFNWNAFRANSFILQLPLLPAHYCSLFNYVSPSRQHGLTDGGFLFPRTN